MLSVECSKMIPMISKVPTLILGMDVSHGSPGQSDIPSIAAVLNTCAQVVTSFCVHVLISAVNGVCPCVNRWLAPGGGR